MDEYCPIIIKILFLFYLSLLSWNNISVSALGFSDYSNYDGPTPKTFADDEEVKETFPSDIEVNVTHVFRELMNNYDANDHPNAQRSKATTVEVNVYVVQMYAVNDVNMDYWIILYLRQRWNDPRLQWHHIVHDQFAHLSKKSLMNLTLTLDSQTLSKLWLPDTFFANDREGRSHDVSKPNKLLRIRSNGDILYSQRLSLRMSCPMDMRYFPFDTQTCVMEVASYAYTNRKIRLIWTNKTIPVEVNRKLQLPEFFLKKYNHSTEARIHSTGTYSGLLLTFVLRRQSGYFLIQTYIPTILIVILSWFSFWIDAEAVPARVTLGLLTVLTIITQKAGVRDIPKVSYVKAIDIWNATCLSFVFFALLEFAIVNVLIRQEKVRNDKERRRKKIRKSITQRRSKDSQTYPEDEAIIPMLVQTKMDKDNYYSPVHTDEIYPNCTNHTQNPGCQSTINRQRHGGTPRQIPIQNQNSSIIVQHSVPQTFTLYNASHYTNNNNTNNNNNNNINNSDNNNDVSEESSNVTTLDEDNFSEENLTLTKDMTNTKSLIKFPFGQPVTIYSCNDNQWKTLPKSQFPSDASKENKLSKSETNDIELCWNDRNIRRDRNGGKNRKTNLSFCLNDKSEDINFSNNNNRNHCENDDYYEDRLQYIDYCGGRCRANNVEYFARIIFPLAFFAFSLTYWIVYVA
ncbi:hypothetical protein SNEBB_008222 [Seison nebaliae]|nr:hypothetical protein SNEBB_008222 [Seison nebaliae]